MRYVKLFFLLQVYVLISDSDFKIRVYDTVKFDCHKTFLGPTFETPLKSMHQIFSEDSSKVYFKALQQVLRIILQYHLKLKCGTFDSFYVRLGLYCFYNGRSNCWNHGLATCTQQEYTISGCHRACRRYQRYGIISSSHIPVNSRCS